MRKIYPLWGLILLMALPQMASAGGNEAALSFAGYTGSEELLGLNYEIPFDGVVELFIYNDQGERVWHNNYSSMEGKNTIYLRRSAFRPGMNYRYVLKYKLSEHRGILSGDQ